MYHPVEILDMPYKVGFFHTREEKFVIVSMFYDLHEAKSSAKQASTTGRTLSVYDQNNVSIADFTSGMETAKFFAA